MKPVAKVFAALSIVFVVLLAGALFVGACTFTHMHVNGKDWHSGTEASRSETHAFTLTAGQPLVAQVDYGRIRVHPSSDGTAQVVAQLRAFGSDKEDAEKRLAEMNLELGPSSVRGHEKSNSGIHIFSWGGGEEIDLEITLPPGTQLDLKSSSGDVSVEGAFGDTQADSGYGEVKVEGVQGSLSVKSSSGDVSATNVKGARVRLASSYGEVTLRGIEADEIEARTSSGEVRAEQLTAKHAKLTTSYGDIQLRGAKADLELETSSGEIKLSGTEGALRAHSDYGDVKAAGLFRGLALSSSSGEIHADAYPGSEMAGGWDLHSSYGEVKLIVPDGLSFDLDASTSYGEVHQNLKGVLGGSKGDASKKLHGAVGEGGPKLRLHTSSGDIELQRRH